MGSSQEERQRDGLDLVVTIGTQGLSGSWTRREGKVGKEKGKGGLVRERRRKAGREEL